MPAIVAHEHPMLKIFSDDYAFHIPDYQRPYRWQTEQADQLLQDISEAAREATGLMDKRETSEYVSPYFLGSIVLIKQSASPEVDVVDGQQRLTTLSLLLAALRSLLDEQSCQEIGRMLFEAGSSIRGTRDRCRLRLREKDHSFYQRTILEDRSLKGLSEVAVHGLDEAKTNLVNNCLHFVKALESRPAAELSKLAAFLLQHTYLVIVETSHLDSAFRIFSVLNDRGLDLTTADLLKADVIGQVPQELRAEYNSKWEDIEVRLGVDRFDRLITHIVMTYHRQKLKESVKKTFDAVVKAKDRPIDFIDKELLPYANAYEAIIDTDWDGPPAESRRINQALRRLNRIDNRDWVPPALVLFHQLNSKPDKLALAIERLERLAMIIWLTRYGPTERIERYGKLLSDIVQNPHPESSVLFETCEVDQRQAVAVLEGDIFNLTPKQKRTAILLRLDEELSSGEAEYAENLITIEHILPQKPSGQWLDWWPEPSERTKATHCLGNLALLNRRQNTAARNYDFETKKHRYRNTRAKACPFHLTNDVIQYSEWTPEIVASRQRRFVSLLCDAWQVSPRTDEQGGN